MGDVLCATPAVSGDRSIVLREPFPHLPAAWGIASSDFFTASMSRSNIEWGTLSPAKQDTISVGFPVDGDKQLINPRCLAKWDPFRTRAGASMLIQSGANTQAHMCPRPVCTATPPARSRHVTSATSASLFGAAFSYSHGNRAHFLRTKAR